VIIGYCRIVGQELPIQRNINEAAKLTFMKSDSQSSQIEFKELSDYIDNNDLASKIFRKFEAPKTVKEVQKVFLPF